MRRNSIENCKVQLKIIRYRIEYEKWVSLSAESQQVSRKTSTFRGDTRNLRTKIELTSMLQERTNSSLLVRQHQESHRKELPVAAIPSATIMTMIWIPLRSNLEQGSFLVMSNRNFINVIFYFQFYKRKELSLRFYMIKKAGIWKSRFAVLKSVEGNCRMWFLFDLLFSWCFLCCPSITT